ncbi:hypothetical protein V6N11_048274 [Hibiscus sabdariffa]|uniref:Uncharacterized protein n=1 Tax=Hibiscus sabdariffa TaxID=183260 RepID=A0ABR2PV80_9ROSI
MHSFTVILILSVMLDSSHFTFFYVASNLKLMDKHKVIAQYDADAGLMDKFKQYGVYAIEEPSSGKSFTLKGLIGIDAKSLFCLHQVLP